MRGLTGTIGRLVIPDPSNLGQLAESLTGLHPIGFDLVDDELPLTTADVRNLAKHDPGEAYLLQREIEEIKSGELYHA